MDREGVASSQEATKKSIWNDTILDLGAFKHGGHSEQLLIACGGIVAKGKGLRIYVPIDMVKELRQIRSPLPNKAIFIYDRGSAAFFVVIPSLPSLAEFVEAQNFAIRTTQMRRGRP
jgi:hypothetical protein